MEFIVFIWFFTAVFLLVYEILLNGFFRYIRSDSGYRAGLILLGLVLLFYIPEYEGLWIGWGRALHPRLSHPLLKEVWYIIVFFRPVWPALFAAVCGIAADASAYPESGRYRSMKLFHHSKMLFLLLVLGFYGLLFWMHKDVWIQVLLLNLAVYTASWYWRFGYSTILFALKKVRVSYAAGALMLLGATISAGSAFLLPLMLVMGIGISDIWMDYHNRGAAGLLFTLQLK